MLKKLLYKTSSLFYKLHLVFNRFAETKKTRTPYKLNYVKNERLPKIIHVNGNFIVGGTSQLIVDIIEGTSDKYYHKIVVPYLEQPLPYQPVDIQKFSIYELSSLFDFLKKEQPLFVHIHYWVRYVHRFETYSIWYQAIFGICEELNIKIIQNVNVPTKPFQNRAVVHNVFVSKYVLNEFNTSNQTPASVIYPGSDFDHFSIKSINPMNHKSIGMVYRLDTDKLNEASIEVFINVARKAPDVKCYIVGGGYYLNYYKKRVREERMFANFIFTGYISYNELPKYYRKMGIFVTPVHDESFGQVTPFAMSMGLVVAGFKTGALPEILGYDDTLVPGGNVVELADRIIDLLNNLDKRTEYSKKNIERAHLLFSVDKMVASYIKLYETFS